MIIFLYHLEYTDFFLHCYAHNISANATFFRCFLSDLEAYTSSKWSFFKSTWLDCFNSLKHKRVKVLSYRKYSLFWGFLMLFFYLHAGLKLQSPDDFTWKFFDQTLISVSPRVLLDNSKWIFWNYKPNIFIKLWNTTYNYYVHFLC